MGKALFGIGQQAMAFVSIVQRLGIGTQPGQCGAMLSSEGISGRLVQSRTGMRLNKYAKQQKAEQTEALRSKLSSGWRTGSARHVRHKRAQQ